MLSRGLSKAAEMPSIIIFTAVPNFDSDMRKLSLKGSAWISLSSRKRCKDIDTPTIVGELHQERSASFGLSVALRKMKTTRRSPKISCTTHPLEYRALYNQFRRLRSATKA
ncbi:hypothetical protein EDD53_1387 [Pacificibacter maritimus]|uniref:Uncharacterized protein n=1 Tax=Pacificibacter maritimus TaxID=762213 RepID=A0A3N4U8B6_9RHOB|nr:hypothetical protein [Pacificibacter maritimus]RPE66983.1 hypothetical protein EDD53_1387 [Pacificibacter maritimus]